MIRSIFLGFFILICVALVAQSASPRGNDPSANSTAKTADVAGKWQISWEGRLGVEQGALELHQDGSKLSGSFQDLHGVEQVSGTVVEKQILFDVQFSGKRPFAIRFKGTVDTESNSVELKGTSQALGVEGAGAYLGHAGEVVQPEHPWSAKRAADQPAAEVSRASSPASK